ncbi:MAG: MarR family transcriptional regulator [Nocardioidaceae bacterium]|nr:MarR family transcriptional regulator [Nocardioidaceae bacterium]
MTQDRIDLDVSVGYALKHAAAALRTSMDAALRPLDLNVSQYSCLEVLGHRPGLSVAELARATFVTRQSMHTVLQGLQDRGLLSRPASVPSGRALPTRLTPDGTHLLTRASAAVAEVEASMLRDLSAAARVRLHGDLVACTSALVEG